MGKRKSNPIRGYGARYGSSLRKRYSKVYRVLKKRYRCPSCESNSVVRKSVGVWTCKKCGLTFTGGAYRPSTKLGLVAKRIAKASGK